MGRIENMISETKLGEILNKRDRDRAKNTILWIVGIIAAVAAIAGIAYAVYRFLTPDYLGNFEEDLDDDFEDEFFEDEDL